MTQDRATEIAKKVRGHWYYDGSPLNDDAARFLAEAIREALAAAHKEGERVAGVRLAEVQMLAYGWMRAHDLLKAGKSYEFPAPADLPNAITAAREEGERRGRLAGLEEAARWLEEVRFYPMAAKMVRALAPKEKTP